MRTFNCAPTDNGRAPDGLGDRHLNDNGGVWWRIEQHHLERYSCRDTFREQPHFLERRQRRQRPSVNNRDRFRERDAELLGILDFAQQFLRDQQLRHQRRSGVKLHDQRDFYADGRRPRHRNTHHY